QALYAETRFIGVGRTNDITNEEIFAAVDKPVEGRLLYLSEPLQESMRLNGIPIVQLSAAPSKGTGNLSAALVEIGRQRRFESGRRTASLVNITAYNLPYGGGLTNSTNVQRYDNPATSGSFSNYKYVTTGWTDVQNPNHDGKTWIECEDTNYIPNFYFQTTKITPGQYYPYTIELEPYDYTFEAGNRIGIMIFGTDPDYSQLYDADCTCAFDIKIGADSYAIIPLILAEPTEPITIGVESKLAAPGDTVDIAYSVKDNVFGFCTLDVELPFDSALYTPVAIKPAGLLSDDDLTYAIDGNVLKVSVAAGNNILGDGDLFTVTYKIGADAAYTFSAPLNVNVIEAKYNSLLEKLADVDVVVKAGAISPYNFNVYLQTPPGSYKTGDTVLVDIMLGGNLNYTQVNAAIAYDADLLEYAGYTYLAGLVAEVKKDGNGNIALRNVPSLNMFLGASCLNPVKLATLKFTVKYTEEDIDTALGLASKTVNPVAGISAYTTAPAKSVDLLILPQ
ncbi:MAG: cohesin domain-containing protein, partial [Clostridiales bacterium]|nr:cohesin domain-containing protein [Clostridiales bacterium]